MTLNNTISGNEDLDKVVDNICKERLNISLKEFMEAPWDYTNSPHYDTIVFLLNLPMECERNE